MLDSCNFRSRSLHFGFRGLQNFSKNLSKSNFQAMKILCNQNELKIWLLNPNLDDHVMSKSK